MAMAPPDLLPPPLWGRAREGSGVGPMSAQELPPPPTPPRKGEEGTPGLPLRSRITTDGLDRTPHRAFMRAMGLDDAAIGKAMIGVVSQKGEVTPCNMTHY